MKNGSPSQGLATERVLELVAEMASSFGSRTRLKILQTLAQAPRGVEALAESTGESVANTSQHLQKLLRLGLLSVHKSGLTRVYQLKDECVAEFIENLFDLGERVSVELQAVQAGISEAGIVTSQSPEEIFREVDMHKALLIDVRDDLESGHSPVEGALAIPYTELEARLKSLPRGKTYYLFCRGRACPMASDGVRLLRSRGLKAFRLKESPIALRRKKSPAEEGEST